MEQPQEWPTDVIPNSVVPLLKLHSGGINQVARRQSTTCRLEGISKVLFLNSVKVPKFKPA